MTHHKRRLSIAAVSGILCLSRLASADRPNLIVVMADDLGCANMAFNGCKDMPASHDILLAHPDVASELERWRIQWDAELMAPRFFGVIHSVTWQNKKR